MGKRYIDADKLIELIDDDIAALDNDIPQIAYDVCLCTLRMVKQYIKALQKDATNAEQFENCGTKHGEYVKVVRCKDCTYWEQAKPDSGSCNRAFEITAYANDFCSYGERKDEVGK